MGIQNVTIIEGCIACGLCVSECPEVFEMQDVAVVKPGIAYSNYEDCVKSAAAGCPVEVIKYS
jgi:ferredoxin